MKSECQSCHRVLNFVIDGKCRKCRKACLNRRKVGYVKCDVCNKSIYASNIKEHMEWHDDQKHICDVCERAFSTSRQLKSHMKAHDKELMRKALERRHATNLRKYGAEQYLCSKEGRKRFENTMIDRYGVNCSFKSKKIMEKAKDTMNFKFGCDFSSQNKKLMQRQYETRRLNAYGCEAYEVLYDAEKLSSFIEKHGHPSYIDLTNAIHEELIGSERVTKQLVYNRIRFYGLENMIKKMGRKSSYENVMSDFLKSNGIKVECNVRILDGKEIDIYNALSRVGIEIDGAYWHSKKMAGKTCQYDKTLLCEQHDIDVIHVFEQDFVENEEWQKRFCLSRIKNENASGQISKIGKADAQIFYESHSSLVLPASCSYFSFCNNDSLVAVFCKKKNRIVSFLSSLDIDLKHAMSKLGVDEIILDRSRFSSVYAKKHDLNVITSIEPSSFIQYGHEMYDSGKIICKF